MSAETGSQSHCHILFMNNAITSVSISTESLAPDYFITARSQQGDSFIQIKYP